MTLVYSKLTDMHTIRCRICERNYVKFIWYKQYCLDSIKFVMACDLRFSHPCC
jgi:hypothetical protein